MQDEIEARLASALDTELVAAEARRAEQAPTPDSMDLYFRGMASFNKGLTPEYLSQARDFFERSLALDPGNISAQVGAAAVHVMAANTYQTDDQTVRLASAEEALMGVLLRVPDHAYAHFLMGLTLTLTHRPSQGIAEYERALALDSNLAAARAHIGVTKHRLGCAEETEADVQAALRLSPSVNGPPRYMPATAKPAGRKTTVAYPSETESRSPALPVTTYATDKTKHASSFSSAVQLGACGGRSVIALRPWQRRLDCRFLPRPLRRRHGIDTSVAWRTSVALGHGALNFDRAAHRMTTLPSS
jgi:tetratricopeptide (TPR) repeat protein